MSRQYESHSNVGAGSNGDGAVSTSSATLPREAAPRRRGSLRGYLIGGFVLLVVALSPLVLNGYYMNLAILSGIGCILALALNLLYGYCGQVNFGIAGYYAVGAYSCVLLQNQLHLPFFAVLPLTVVMGALAGLVTGVPLLRLRGHMLSLGTLAFSLAAYGFLGSSTTFTGGENGIMAPTLILFGRPADDVFFLYLVTAAVVLTFVACRNLGFSKVGRAMKAIRADEKVAEMSGIFVFRYRLLAFVTNTALAAFAGALLAEYDHWIGVNQFDISVNVLVLVMVCFGGLGSNVGALIGGALLMSLPELLSGFQQYRALVTGVILLLTLRFLPGGVAGALRQIFRLPAGSLG